MENLLQVTDSNALNSVHKTIIQAFGENIVCLSQSHACIISTVEKKGSINCFNSSIAQGMLTIRYNTKCH